MYKNVVKPILDFILALMFVALFWWVYIILAILVRIKHGSPVLFVQERPGKINPKTGKEKIIKLYKFRTMTDERNLNGELLPDEVRLTRFGKILRSTSADERVIIGQTTESLINKGFREVSPIHFHRGHDLLFYNARDAIIEGVLCQSA